MRKILIFFGFIVFSISDLFAQVELNEQEDFKILDNYELATGKNHDTKSLLKLTRDGGFNNNLTHSYEHKLTESFSFVAGLRAERYTAFIFETPVPTMIDTLLNIEPLLIFTGETETRLRVEATLEGRFYVNQSDLIAQGFGNNINGLYATAGIGSKLYEGGIDISNRLFTYMGVGIQSRILKYGILDFRILATYRNERFRITPNINAGFAMSKNYKNLEFDNARCNILKCFEERNYQFKVPLNNALSLAYTPEFQHVYVSLRPRVKFEHRLFKGFSFNHAISYSNNWNLNFRGVNSVLPSGGIFGYNNNLRWYVLKSRNIASGKSADNLSGVYAETLFGFSWARIIYPENFMVDNQILAYKTRTRNLGLSVGYQTRLFKRLYVDAKGFYRLYDRTVTYTDDAILVDPPGLDSYSRYGISLEFGFLF